MPGVRRLLSVAAIAAGLLHGPALAEDCLNPNALGTLRTIAVDPAALGRVGTMQYRETLQLAPKEIVLTFDDGPMPPMTSKVLEILRNECVRATFFLVGRHAQAFPALTRAIAADGHTVANHTQNHPLQTMSGAHGTREMDTGFRSIAAALAPDGAKPAPFFRFPGLLNSHAVESYAKSKGVAVFSTDFLADDWKQISAEQILVRGMARLNAKGSGIMLLHDVQPGTVLILPKLLNELKARGYRIVHLVPAPGAEPEIAAPALVAERPAPSAKPAAATKTASAKKKHVAVAALEPALPDFKFVSRWRKYWDTQRSAAVARATP
jgi:peptidoglycan/xylan/chitin deacetylase (PgdA/CDA1 family)